MLKVPRPRCKLFTMQQDFSVIFLLGVGVRLQSTWYVGHWPIVPAPDDDECEQSVEWVSGETEVFGENLPRFRFVHHKSHLTWPRTPGPVTNRLSYGTAFSHSLLNQLA
jgi:hypothetical protein